MGKIKNLFKINKGEGPLLLMVAGGSLLMTIALKRSGARDVIDSINKSGCKVLDADGQEIVLGLKPLIHID